MVSRSSVLLLAALVGWLPRISAQGWLPLGPDDNNWPSDLTVGKNGLALDSDGNPEIAYRGNYLDYGLTVRRWSGSHWHNIGTTGFANSGSGPCLADDGQGRLFVAYQDVDHGYKVSVRRWTGGAWQLVGTPGFTADVATPSGLEVDAQGRPIVAFEDNTLQGRASVWHWTGAIWEPVGTPGFSAGDVAYLSLAVDMNGKPVVAYRDNASDKRTTVQRWNGSDWELIGTAGFSPDSANYQQIAVDADGNPVVIYQEIGATYYEHTTVQRWDGASWNIVGPRGFSEDWARSQSIAIGPSGDLVVAYLDDSPNGYRVTVEKWNGSDWQQYGGEGPEGLFSLGMAIGPTGAPIIAYTNLSYGGRTTVQRWSGDAWEVLGDLGFSVDSTIAEANKVSLAIDLTGYPVVAYSDGADFNRISLRRWNGNSWVSIGEDGFAQGGGSWSMKIDSSGLPVVAYQDGPFGKASVSRWTGTSWELIGDAQFSAMQAYYLDLAIDLNGNPVVAYQDRENGYKTSVQRWNGSAWVMVGPAGFTQELASDQSIAIGIDGTLYLADRSGYQDQVRVRRWDGTIWQVMGGIAGFGTQFDSDIAMVLDSLGNPIIAYNSYSLSPGITVRQWNGSAWELLGPEGFASVYSHSISLAIDSGGAPVIAYRDPDASIGVTVQHWNGSSWEVVGIPGFTAGVTSFAKDWIQVNNQGKIIVAYACGGAYAQAFPDADFTQKGTDGMMRIGPNPNTNGELWINVNNLPMSLKEVLLELHDMVGRQVGLQLIPVDQGQLNTRVTLPVGLSNGMYIASVVGGGERWSARFVVTKP